MMSNIVAGGFEGEIISSYPAVGVSIVPGGNHALVCVPSHMYSFNIDTDSGRVVKFNTAGTMGWFRCVFSRDGRRGYYLANKTSGVYSFFVDSGLGAGFSGFGENLRAIVVSPEGGRLYIAQGEDVLVLDSMNLGLTKVVPVDGVIDSLAVSPDGLYLYILVNGKFLIARVSDWVMKSISLGAGTGCMSLGLDGRRAYIAGSHQGGTVQVIDIDEETVIASMPISGEAIDCALSPEETRFYITTINEPKLCVVDIAGDPILVREILVGGSPSGVDVTPDGSRVYVCTGDFVKVFAAVSDPE